MSGLAEILLNLGYDVSGSDLKASDITSHLEKQGLAFHEGHNTSHVGDAGIVVVSAAVNDDNPEVEEARRHDVPVIHRSELLADLMRLKPNAVAVGGTHGKTTTTSMISAILDHADIDATSIIGGILHRSGTNARWGTGNYLVAEADEHDGSFLRLHPTISVVTNIDAEHIEYYGTLDQIKRAFTEFCNGVPFYGYSILCADDANCASILGDLESVCITYGLGEGASIMADEISLHAPDPQQPLLGQLDKLRTEFRVTCHDDRVPQQGTLGTISIHGMGENTVRNALGAATVGLCLGLPFDQIAEGIASYDGVRRRLQVCGVSHGVTVVEDYAHHPTEITSTVSAVKLAEPKRLICVFQPHLYTRTKYFYDEFATALAAADLALVTDIYPSREEPMPGVESGLIVDAARSQGAPHVELIRDMADVPDALAAEVKEGDLVLVMGAGDINRMCTPIIEAIATANGKGA
jgi:UDP-N-acetylmuramate--alanine ligase